MAIFRACAKVLEPGDPALRLCEAGLSSCAGGPGLVLADVLRGTGEGGQVSRAGGHRPVLAAIRPGGPVIAGRVSRPSGPDLVVSAGRGQARRRTRRDSIITETFGRDGSHRFP